MAAGMSASEEAVATKADISLTSCPDPERPKHEAVFPMVDRWYGGDPDPSLWMANVLGLA
jgi:hypothetical protein